MRDIDTIVASFADHPAAETAIKELASAGFDMKNLSVVGKGYHSDEKIMGFYNAGDRIKFWGTRGAFWGGFWGLFFGGLFLTVPVVGQVFVLGYLATIAITAIEGALVVGGVNALGAALYSIGIPKDSVLQYETAEIARAKTILGTVNPSQIDLHPGAETAPPPIAAVG
jgi:hypothetical protein